MTELDAPLRLSPVRRRRTGKRQAPWLLLGYSQRRGSCASMESVAD